MTIESQAIKDSTFQFKNQSKVYKGKVRDVYFIGDKLLMVATDRISAFDHVLPRPIPFKGQVLNQLSAYFLQSTSEIVPNWLENTPDPNISIGKICKPIKLEMVIRGYLAGHAYREYHLGKRTICGVSMPDGMRQNQRFPEPIITPATKAEEGHDEDISQEEILKRNILTIEQWEKLVEYTRSLFEKGTQMAAERGLILVDTKYEFGFFEDEIYLIDEIHTPDSSRYFLADEYEGRFEKGMTQKQLSKEFVREWLMENGFQGKAGQKIPIMSDEWIWTISDRYIELYETLTGEKFIKADTIDIISRIKRNVNHYQNSK